jgi:hypothetical protein
MTKREKILAMLVVATLAVVGGIYVVNQVMTAFDRRLDDRINWDQTIAKQNSTKTRGKRAERNLRDWRSRSLPEDRALAQALYLDWLGKRADAVGLDGRKVSPASSHSEGDVYYVHRFLLSGTGDLQQLTRLLYDFYSVDHMHRISRLSIKPLADSKRLDISMTVEAIAIAGSPNREQLEEPPSNRLARPDVEQYVSTIISRNFFSPANQPPSVAASISEEGHLNKALSVKLQAKDPDSDSLAFFLEGDAPEGLSIEKSGDVRWTPTELGEFEISFRVEDGGLPSKSAQGTLKLAIVEAPVQPPAKPADPGFDPATQAAVSAIITESSGQPAIWINVRTEGKILKLHEGDEVSVGTVKGTIANIRVAEKAAEITTSDGGTIVLALGETLVEA